MDKLTKDDKETVSCCGCFFACLGSSLLLAAVGVWLGWFAFFVCSAVMCFGVFGFCVFVGFKNREE